MMMMMNQNKVFSRTKTDHFQDNKAVSEIASKKQYAVFFNFAFRRETTVKNSKR